MRDTATSSMIRLCCNRKSHQGVPHTVYLHVNMTIGPYAYERSHVCECGCMYQCMCACCVHCVNEQALIYSDERSAQTWRGLPPELTVHALYPARDGERFALTTVTRHVPIVLGDGGAGVAAWEISVSDLPHAPVRVPSPVMSP